MDKSTDSVLGLNKRDEASSSLLFLSTQERHIITLLFFKWYLIFIYCRPLGWVFNFIFIRITQLLPTLKGTRRELMITMPLMRRNYLPLLTLQRRPGLRIWETLKGTRRELMILMQLLLRRTVIPLFALQRRPGLMNWIR